MPRPFRSTTSRPLRRLPWSECRRISRRGDERHVANPGDVDGSSGRRVVGTARRRGPGNRDDEIECARNAGGGRCHVLFRGGGHRRFGHGRRGGAPGYRDRQALRCDAAHRHGLQAQAGAGGHRPRGIPGSARARRRGRRRARRTARLAGIEVQAHTGTGDPARSIVEVAELENADLIVVGNKGMVGVRRVLGSVPNSVAHQAPCSVMIVQTT